MNSMKNHCASVALFVIFTAVCTFAQEPPVNTTAVGQWDGYAGNYADVWGQDGLALVCHYGHNGVHIIDISNPASPSLLAHYLVPSPSNDASAQDVQSANGLMFIGLENETSNSVDIVDIRNPAAPVHKTFINIANCTTVHDVFYDNGYLYFCDSDSGATREVVVIDLTTYDPDAAPTTITTAKWIVNPIGTQFVHDMTVVNGRMYVCAWDGLYVYNVENIATQPPQLMGSVAGTSVHSAWPTADRKFVVFAEERSGGGIKCYETFDNGSTVSLTLRDTFNFSTSDTYCIHDPRIIGNRVYCSAYQLGLQIFDLDPVTGSLTQFGSFDTTASTGLDGFIGPYDGAWGAYPYNGIDQVLVTDLQTGLWIVDVEPPTTLTFSFPDGFPDVIPPQQDTHFHIHIDEDGESSIPSTAMIHYRQGSGPFVAAPLNYDGEVHYHAMLRPASCGAPFEYYFSVEGSLGTVLLSPNGAPATFYSTAVGTLDIVFEDNFATNLGWTVNNVSVTDGAWVRANPLVGDNGDRLDPPDDFDGNNACYVTGNNAVQDLDGGPTRLTSPVLDLSGGDAIFSYTRWFRNDDLDGDAMVVEVSNNNGASWVTFETVVDTTFVHQEAWVLRHFTLDSLGLAPTAQVRVRFSATDNPNNSVTEAGIDRFRVGRLVCQNIFPPGDTNCDGTINPFDVQPFLTALADPEGYPSLYPDCFLNQADVNQDGTVNPFDIQVFLELL